MERVIEKYQALPFEWGVSDCCQFIGECIEAMTGVDHLARFAYSGRAGARKLLRQYGGLENLVSAVLGPPVERTAQHGDIVSVHQGDGPLLGVIWRDRLLLRTESGLVDWPAEYAETIWAP